MGEKDISSSSLDSLILDDDVLPRHDCLRSAILVACKCRKHRSHGFYWMVESYDWEWNGHDGQGTGGVKEF